MRKFILLLASVVLSAPALADGELPGLLTQYDRDRLSRFEATLTEALAEARSGGSPVDVALVENILARPPVAAGADFDASGTWRCRTIKLGGMLPLVAYPEFTCRISDDGAGWFLRKLTGSQRTEGRFYTESATRMVYVGAGFVIGEKPRRYGDDPKQDQVAYAERRGPDTLVLMFPAPQYESKLDLLVLER